IERPTSALQSAGYAVRGPLNAELHTKEAGHVEVYNHHCVRSPRGHHRCRRVVTEPPNTSASFADIGQCHVLRFVERLRRAGPVQCCYEAGPCGFELQRALTTHGVPCDVIAPALIPRRPGDRVKTDRRDAGQLAILYRADALTAIHIPTEIEEAVRDLLRCREDIRIDLLRARHRLSKFLLRHG